MALFFTADTHFGDHRTINIHRRPFSSAAEMNEVLIARWNCVVAPGDEVWHLGDFCRKEGDAPGLLERLNGRKHLVAGNNDAPALEGLSGWESAQVYKELDHGDHLLVLCHYPFRSWNGQHKRSINLHGHSHGRMKPLTRQLDVGVDAWEFQPVSVKEVFARLRI